MPQLIGPAFKPIKPMNATHCDIPEGLSEVDALELIQPRRSRELALAA